MSAKDGKARLAGVIGYPISHSLSPALHEFWLQEHAINGAYVPLSIAPENFASHLRTLIDCGFIGFNVTLPHKETAWELVDVKDEAATIIGAVNTIHVKDNTLYGFNTDAYGFIQHLQHAAASQLTQSPISQRNALIVGAGGAARAVCVGLIQAGCTQLTLTNRNLSRAEALKASLIRHYPAHGLNIQMVAWEDKNQQVQQESFGLIVNTTQCGMHGQPPLDLSLEGVSSECIISDIVYRPLNTPLLQQAQRLGLHTVDGIGMLLWQAQAGFTMWFGIEPEVNDALRTHMLTLTGDA